MHISPAVAIIIVNWNNYPDTARCLDSLRKLDYLNYQVMVVDNGSSDGSAGKISREFPELVVLRAEKNRGFAAGNNIALNYVLKNDYPYVLLLNNDTEVIYPGFLGDLVAEADQHPQVGAVAPQVQLPDGTIQDTILPFPTLGVTIWNTLGFYGNRLDRKQDVDSLSGCCVLVKRQAIQEAGLLDENFFMYGEETEWFYRIRKAGWIIRFLPQRSVLHHRAASSRNLDQIRLYIERRANVIYTLIKHDLLFQARIMKVFMRCLLAVRLIVWSVTGRCARDPQVILDTLERYQQAVDEKITLASSN